MKLNNALDKMLVQYRLCAFMAIFSFILFIFLMIVGIRSESAHPFIPFAIYLSAMFWIGMTALCRHSYVVLKTAMGKRIGIGEFLSTNLVVILFPFVYRKIKKELELFKTRNDSGKTQT